MARTKGKLKKLRVIPLGGYCAFDGEDDFETETKPSETAEEQNGTEIFADVTASENVQPIEKSEPTDVEKTEENFRLFCRF